MGNVNFICDLGNAIYPASGEAFAFNEGWDVKMLCPSVWNQYNEETQQYEFYYVTVKIDGNEVALEKDEYGRYEYVFKNKPDKVAALKLFEDEVWKISQDLK